jgi:hypothetical protein
MIMKARLPIRIRILREILASWMRHRRTLIFFNHEILLNILRNFQ